MPLHETPPVEPESHGSLDRISAVLERLLSAAGILCVFAMMLVVLQEVILRYVFNAPSTWSNEIASYLLIAMVFFGLSENLRAGVHIRIDVLLNVLPDGLRAWLERLAYLVGLAFSILLILAVWNSFHSFWVRGTVSDSLLRTPLWLPMTPVLLSCIVFALSMTAGLLRACRS